MNDRSKYKGVIVPMVTPITAAGNLDVPAVDRLVDSLLAGGIENIFVAGTTGESVSVPHSMRLRLVERTVARVQRRALVYAGLGDIHPGEVSAGNDYMRAGADALVARPPVSFPLAKLLSWFRSILDGVDRPVILYNIPSVTNVSIPLDMVAQLVRHPKLIGIKDSENNAKRLQELLGRFGDQPTFSVFIGVGALMVQGLRLGAEGIVPSAGNLIPGVCQRVYESARRGDWAEVDVQYARMTDVHALYQKGRTLGQSIAALKAALACRGLCTAHVLSPLHPLTDAELVVLRGQMTSRGLLE
jgi:dihydrodipicolinate synthase/N-acetylneuraminate lyase